MVVANLYMDKVCQVNLNISQEICNNLSQYKVSIQGQSTQNKAQFPQVSELTCRLHDLIKRRKGGDRPIC